MLNKFIGKINESVKIMILILLIIAIFMAKSIFLILFMTILILIILVLTKKSVKNYIETLKSGLTWLLFFSLMYIIVFRNIHLCLLYIYKFILVILILKCYIMSINFNKLCNGIYTLVTSSVKVIPLKQKNVNSEKISYTITMYIFSIIYYLNSKKQIKLFYIDNDKRIKFIKNNLFSKLFIAMKNIEILENNLKLKFFKVRKEKINFSSCFVLILFSIFFILVVFKEVIL